MTANRVSPAFADHCDIETSSPAYADRFKGPVGAWMLDVQRQGTMALLGGLTGGSRILEVGGGHGQLTAALLEAGHEVVVAGSASICGTMVKPYLSSRCKFDVVDLNRLPYPDREFDAVLSIRLLGHAMDWKRVVAELCRVASRSVIVDYASYRSSNLLARSFFALKHLAEKHVIRPRRFRVFHTGEIEGEFARNGLVVSGTMRQFLWPMFIHRVVRFPRISALLEAPGRLTGATRFLGSPVLVRADRTSDRIPSASLRV